jgi:hypothetical protein
MFYCGECATDLGWPDTPFKSSGRCEMCAQGAICNDMPSGRLPDSTEEGQRKVGARYRLNTLAAQEHRIQEEP